MQGQLHLGFEATIGEINNSTLWSAAYYLCQRHLSRIELAGGGAGASHTRLEAYHEEARNTGLDPKRTSSFVHG
jgi:hypothetical protein